MSFSSTRSRLPLAIRLLGVGAFLAATSVALSSSAEDVTVPASITMKVYRFGLSRYTTCEQMDIYTIEAPAFVDFTSNPTLGTANVPHGIYHCIALEIDQVVSGAPRGTAGNCSPANALSYDYCQLIELAKGPGNTLDGVLPLGGDASQLFQSCKPGGDHFTVYLTTQIRVDDPSNPFRPPTTPTDELHGFHLGAPLVVNERTTGTFVVSAVANSVANGCELGAGSFSFEGGP